MATNVANQQNALKHLHQRRDRMIKDMAFDGRFKLTGARFDQKIDDHAKSLFYIDQAIASLTNVNAERYV
jgi:hypothetical protein